MVAGPVTEQPQPLLDTHVVVERGEFLLDVELQVAPGETVAIMGPNGAGKTSFLYALFGWLPLRSGWILLDGVTIEAPGQDQFVSPHHRDFGMVFDDCLLFPHMTVEQNLAFGTNVEIETSPLVELLELSHLLKNRATALSAGQQQRVALARTLLTSLDGDQTKLAVVDALAPSDILTTNVRSVDPTSKSNPYISLSSNLYAEKSAFKCEKNTVTLRRR